MIVSAPSISLSDPKHDGPDDVPRADPLEIVVRLGLPARTPGCLQRGLPVVHVEVSEYGVRFGLRTARLTASV